MDGYSSKTRKSTHGSKLVLLAPPSSVGKTVLTSTKASYETLYSRSNDGPPYYRASDFSVTKTTLETAPVKVTNKYYGTTTVEKEGYVCILPTGTFSNTLVGSGADSVRTYTLNPTSSASLKLTEAAMMQYGLKGLNRMNPLKPKASLALTIIELKRDLPRLTLSVIKRLSESKRLLDKKTLKAGSSDYLNFQFGIMPLYRDINDLLTAAVRLEKAYNRFVRLNGKWVSRRVTLGSSRDSVRTVSNTNWATVGLSHVGVGTASNYLEVDSTRGNPLERIVTTESRVWATCEYRYYYPEIESNNAQRALYEMRRMGLDFNPILLWELMPWSFLLDWFVNLGDLVEFWTNKANDSLVYRNLCVMAKTTITTEWKCNFKNTTEFWYKPGYPVPAPKTQRLTAECRMVQESKQRLVGDNFGFGNTTGSLNAFQLSILAALGLTGQRRRA